MLRVSQLRKVFNGGNGMGKIALDNVDLHVEPGDFITIIGSNGAGKSTLLNVVAGAYDVDQGRIWIDGQDVTIQPEHRRARFIGRVFQDPMVGTAASMTIEENLAMALKRGQAPGLSRGVSNAERGRCREVLALWIWAGKPFAGPCKVALSGEGRPHPTHGYYLHTQAVTAR